MRPSQVASVVGLSAMFTFLPMASVPAGAQTMDTVGPHSPYCGSWQSGAWVPSGQCVEESTTVTTTTSTNTTPVLEKTPARSRVTGTITSVSGHLVTLQQSTNTIVINDKPALSHQATGRIAVGRSVVAHGYWDGGTFFATRVEGA